MQVPREPRFRPVSMLDEWPLSRPQRPHQGPAQKDHIKGLLYGDEEDQQEQQDNKHKQRQQQHQQNNTVLGRRDPNQQSDPIKADSEHPWNRCGIKKLNPHHHQEHTQGKKIIHSHHNNFSNVSGGGQNNNRNYNTHEAPWEHPESMTALEKKYANYEYQDPRGEQCGQLQQQQQSYEELNHQEDQYYYDNNNNQQRESSSSSSTNNTRNNNNSATSSCSRTARLRAQQQAQGSDWFSLTKASPFSYEAKQEPCDVGPRVGVPCGGRKSSSSSSPRHQQLRLSSSAKLIQLMRILAQTTKRCNSALWQSCLEGHILRQPFQSAPTANATQQEKQQEYYGGHHHFDSSNNNQHDTASSTSASSSAMMMNNNNRLRRSVPFFELTIQLEAALGQDISENALSDVLGLGDCHDHTPVRYEHFLRLFNA